jgi:sigma-E factor negative regulatory protein RseA
MTTLDILHSPSPEWLSALADGELAERELAGASLQQAMQSAAVRSNWNSYQVIGQVLKASAGSSMPQGADSVFLQRLNLRLANEKVEKLAFLVPPVSSPVLVAVPNQPAANAAVFRWQLVAGFASLSAALVVAGSFVGSPDASTASQLAQRAVAEQVVVASPLGPMVRDVRLEELMTAHKQLGGSSLQAPSGFLRNASFENSQSGQR